MVFHATNLPTTYKAERSINCVNFLLFFGIRIPTRNVNINIYLLTTIIIFDERLKFSLKNFVKIAKMCILF